MGLDTTHDCWHGGYSGFYEFRKMVGLAAKLPYRVETEGHRAGDLTLDIDWDAITLRQIDGHWDRKGPTVKAAGIYDPPITDPVLYLLVHSDCDGKLRRGYLPALRDRLIELEPEYERLTMEKPYLQSRLRQFIDGLDAAIEAGEHVEFG
ncbi:hypothetical protein [Mycolicibacterium gilvum]|uniref:hypothetical protein n=1 Tax=Mycolicibacterium gilvum TaxID=1804 RepID=UPI0040457359